MTNPESTTAKTRKPRVQRKPRVVKARAYDKDGREVARFFDRGPIKALVDPLLVPMFLNKPSGKFQKQDKNNHET